MKGFHLKSFVVAMYKSTYMIYVAIIDTTIHTRCILWSLSQLCMYVNAAV